MQDNVPITVSMISPDPAGWYEVTVEKTGGKYVSIRHNLREASYWEASLFMELLPRFIAVAVHPVEKDEATWLCVPWNASDAEQRGWMAGAPRIVHLVKGNVQPLDIIVTRNMAGTLLFDGFADWLVALKQPPPDTASALLQEYLNPVPEEERKIRGQIAFMGATLIDIQERGYNFDVTWEYNGASFTATIRSSGRVASAGICLSGTDGQHTMSSLIAVMEDARRLHRPDVNREFYL